MVAWNVIVWTGTIGQRTMEGKIVGPIRTRFPLSMADDKLYTVNKNQAASVMTRTRIMMTTGDRLCLGRLSFASTQLVTEVRGYTYDS